MSSSKLYVGNLSFKTTEAELTETFSAYGTVARATIVTDRETGRARGFAFVEMSSASEAQAAIDGLDGKSLDGRQIQVNVARPREDRGGGAGGGRGGGGGGRDGGGGGRQSRW
jgi:cold-inducible RNA-binding protein